MRRALITAGAAALLAVSGCGAQEPEVAKDASYGQVVALKDAAVSAGYACPQWTQDNVTGAESGFCVPDGDGSKDQFVTFTDTDQRDQVVNSTKVFQRALGADWGVLIVGPNWLIRLPETDAPKVQEKLGGVISR